MIVGFGLGYHVDIILETNRFVSLIIIEPSLSFFKEAMKARDISHILVSPRVLIYHDINLFNFDELMGENAVIRTVVLRPYFELYKEKIKKIQQNINSFLNKKEINIATLNRFDRLWTKNTLKNFLYFFTFPGVK